MQGVEGKGCNLGFEAWFGTRRRIDQGNFMAALDQRLGQIDDVSASAAAGWFYDQ